MSEIVALITARKNSKRVPGKNLKLLWGEPLIVHTFKAALSSKKIDRIVLSTDDDEVINLASNFPGIEVHFKRPEIFAQDHSNDLEVFSHALNCLCDLGIDLEIFVHLRPTSPLRTSDHIDGAIRLILNDPTATSVRSVKRVDQSIFKSYFLRDKFLEYKELDAIRDARDMPNQLLPQTFVHVGYVDVTKASTIKELKSMTGNKILPYVIENSFSGINTIEDFTFYESLK